jgi:uncharacterized repeat protein (TIGR01451 family)
VLQRLAIGLALGVAWVPAAAPAQAVETADLSITASWAGGGPAKASVGETVTYAVSVTNLGSGTASGVIVLAQTPDQFNPVSLTCSDASFCSEPGGILVAGSTVTATVVDVVCCFPKGESRTTSAGATVVAATADPNLDNNSASVVTRIVGPHGFSFSG